MTGNISDDTRRGLGECCGVKQPGTLVLGITGMAHQSPLSTTISGDQFIAIIVVVGRIVHV